MAPNKRSRSTPPAHRPRAPYTYTSLPSPSHIRLLTIIHYDAITYHLHARLDAVPLSQIAGHYTALSYTWGPPVEPFAPTAPGLPPSPHTITLSIIPQAAYTTFARIDDLARDPTCSLLDLYTTDVRTLSVGNNLSDWFVTYLHGWPDKHFAPIPGGDRQRDLFTNTVFWIDAICINQTDPVEKASQIPLMGEIYSRSGRVLGWLGMDTGRLDTIGWWHSVVYPRLKSFLAHKGEDGMRTLRLARLTDASFWLSTLSLSPPAGTTWISAWTAYWSFYRERKWFHRAWIVQEAVLAARLDLLAGDGSISLSWHEMARLAYLVGEAGWIDTLNTLAVKMLPPEYTSQFSRGFGIADIHGLQRDGESGWHILSHGWTQSWWAAVSAVRKRGCFLPEDKVYATLGILGQLLGGSQRVPFVVIPGATAEEVYLQAAKTLILNSPKAPLTVLSFVEPEFHRNLKSLPSWVPDLTTAYFGCPIGAYDTSFTAGLPASSLPIITDKGELKVRGRRLDTIATISEYQAPLTTHLCITTLEIITTLPVTYPRALSGQDRVAAVIHTVTCQEASNPFRGTIEQTARMVKDFTAWMLVGLGQIWVAAGLRPDDADYNVDKVDVWVQKRDHVIHLLETIGPHGLLPNTDEIAAHAEEVISARLGKGEWPVTIISPMSFKDQIQRVMVYRSLFTGVDGWLGACRQTCEAGDEIWMLEGGAVPFVLRPVEGSGRGVYTFMGECYVHGAMDGHVIADKSWEDGDDVTII